MGEAVFETPWFLQTATTEIGRVNKIVDDRLQRSITELEFKQRKSIEKIDRQIDVVKKELKDIHINVDFASDLEIPKHVIRVKDQKRSHSTGKIENKKRKKRRKTKPDQSQSAPVSVLDEHKERDKHFLVKLDNRDRRYSPVKGGELKKTRHPLYRAQTELNGFLPKILTNNEETAVAYYSNRNTQTPKPNDEYNRKTPNREREFKLISVIMQASKDKSSPSPKMWRKVKPVTRTHYAFEHIES